MDFHNHQYIFGTVLTTDFSDISGSNCVLPVCIAIYREILTVMEAGGLARYKTWFNPPFPSEMPVPSQTITVVSIFPDFAFILPFVIWTFPLTIPFDYCMDFCL